MLRDRRLLNAGPGVAAAGRPALVAAAAALAVSVPLVYGAIQAPLLTLGVVGGSLAFALSVLRVDLALLVLVATIPLEAAFAPFASVLSVTKVAGVICFASFVLNCFVTRRKFQVESTHAFVFGLLAVALLSSVQALNATDALTTTMRYASFALLFLIISQLAVEPVQQRRIVWTLSAAGAASAWIALDRYLDGVDYFAGLPYASPGEYAFVLVATIPLTVWLVGRAAWPLRFVALGMAAIMTVAVVFSFSRGALVGLAAAGAYAVIVHWRRLPVILLVVGLAIALVVGVYKRDPGRFDTSFEVKGNIAQTNIESRLDTWAAALELTAQQPLLGVGPGNFQDYFSKATGRPAGTEQLTQVHNSYLDVATETGLIGAAAFILYLITVVGRARTATRRRLGAPGIGFALTVALVGVIVAGFFLSGQYAAPFWVLGGLAVAACHDPARGVVQPAERRRAA
jgi:O-antigen ligase